MSRHILIIYAAGVLLNGIYCFNSPTQLHGTHALDCSTPTMPETNSSDTAGIAGVIEIYDFEQRLIAYSSLKPDSARTKLFYTWDGKDMNGNPVDPGKYISKTSIIDYARGKSECVCSEVFVAPQ